MKKLILILIICFFVIHGFSQTHFKVANSAAGADFMVLVVSDAVINSVPMESGDEIAVFDGNLCCGVVKLTQSVNPSDINTFVDLNANPDDGLDGSISDGSPNGFTMGNKVYLRFWDSSTGVEYHNVIVQFYDSGKNPISAQSFQESSTAYITASTATTTLTWVGGNLAGGSQNWSNINNWNPKVIPEPYHSVVIPTTVVSTKWPIIFPGTMASAGSLSIADNIILTIWSDDTGDGSLVVSNGISGTGTAIGSRWMTPNSWHLVSSPFSGLSISDFLSLNSAVPTKNTDTRGLMTYNESNDIWNNFFTNSSGGNIDRGVGYCVRIDDQGDPASNYIAYSGLLTNGNITTSVTKSNFGWNLVGNPFTSAIYLKQEVHGFLKVNETILDPSYKAIYLWDQTANAGSGGYTVINSNEGQANLASGQGFFIKAASSGNVTFTQKMQVHQTDAPFKSSVMPWPSIVLSARVGNVASSTKISFNKEMNLGLDPGYDAGILKSGNGFDIYSRLVTDNGVNFAIQSLPGKSTDRYIIPVGVDATKGGEIVFSANSLYLPMGYQLILEDKLTNSFTDIKNGEMYVCNLASNSNGIGRFYLHVGASLQTGIQEIQEDKLLVYTIDNTVYIKGDVSNDAQFVVYTIDGRLINRFDAISQNLNRMSIIGFAPGIYFVSVLDNKKHKPVKFIVGN